MISHEEHPLSLERVDSSVEALRAVQRVFDEAPDYARRVTGRGPDGGEAEDLRRLRPGNRPYVDKRVYLIRAAEEAVGVVDLLLDYPDHGTCFLGLLLLRGDARGRGLGRTSFEMVERLARSRGARRMRLGVLGTNEDVVPFWKRMGFCETGERTAYEREAVTSEVIVMEKDLRSTAEPGARRRRIRFVSDDLVEEIIRGEKTASVCRLGELDLIEDEYDDPLFVGELYDVFDSHGARRGAIRVLAMELCRWEAVPERLWRGEGNRDADAFRRDHMDYFGSPGPETEFVAYYFDSVPPVEPGPGVRIRAYCQDDWGGVCAVHDRARRVELGFLGPPEEIAPMAEVAQKERFYDGTTFVAEHEGRVVGFVTVEGPELTWLYVDPDRHGRGIGRALFEHVAALIGGDGYVLCGADNEAAVRFYEGCGFRLAAVFPGCAEGRACACARLCLPGSAHRDRPPRPSAEALRLAGYPENASGRPVRGSDAVWRWERNAEQAGGSDDDV